MVLLIVGLLGMHALSGGSSHGTGAEPGVALTSNASHDSHDSHDSHAFEAPHAPDPSGHVGLAACVLALLADLLLLVPPAAGPRASATVTVPWSVLGASAARLFLPPPSLTFLSISRT